MSLITDNIRTRFGKFILRKIITIVATRRHILKLKCTARGTYSPKPLSGFKGPTSKGRKGRKDGGKCRRCGEKSKSCKYCPWGERRGPTSKARGGGGKKAPKPKNQTLSMNRVTARPRTSAHNMTLPAQPQLRRLQIAIDSGAGSCRSIAAARAQAAASSRRRSTGQTDRRTDGRWTIAQTLHRMRAALYSGIQCRNRHNAIEGTGACHSCPWVHVM